MTRAMFPSFVICCFYFTCLKAHEISCKMQEARKIFPISQHRAIATYFLKNK